MKVLTMVSKNNPNTDFKIKQFEKFYYFLTKEAPEDYTPWFFPCEPKGKNPSPKAILKIDNTSKGSWHHKSARLNKEQVIEHIRQGYNIGLSARKGDPLIIVDIDEAGYLDQTIKDTLVATSRKRAGTHTFCWDKDGTAKINLPTDGGEIRSDNQYVLCCGSYVPFNLEDKKDKKAFEELPKEAKEDEHLGYYTIKNSVAPKEITFNELPQFFKDKELENIEAESKIKNRETGKEFSGEGKYSELFKLKVSDIVGLIPANKRQGHPLHESDTDSNFSLSKDGSIAHCWRHLVSLNAVQYLCVKAGYKSCVDCGTPHRGRGISKIKGDKKALSVAYDEAVKLGLISGKTKGGGAEDFLIIKYNKKGEEILRNVDIDKVAEYIENKFNIRTIFGIKEETIEVYQEGVWSVKGRGIIKAEIERLLGVYSKNNIVNEILEKIKRRTEISREETEDIPDFKRCLRNGVLDFEDVDNIKLLPHSKEYNFRTKWDIEYNPKAKCEKYLEVLNKALYEDDLLKFQEWNGIHIRRKYIFKKFAIYHGAKDTSKTLFMNHLTILLNNNVSGLSLQEISRSKPFDLLVLKNKDANICDDLSSSDMKAIGGIKKSVGDGFIDGEFKFGDKIRFPNTAKQTYACNKIPNSGEDIDDEAYYGRIILFPFDNVISKDEQDQDLINKITTPKEMSGWLNWALEGYKRLIKQNGFSNEKEPEEIKFLMIKGGNSLAKFSAEVLVNEAGSKVTKDDLYKVYCRWCLEHKPKLSPDSKDKIGKNLIKFNPYVSSEKSGSERYWLNLKLRDSWDIFLKNMSSYRECVKEVVKSSSQNSIYGFSKPVPLVPNNANSQRELNKEWSEEEKKRMEKVGGNI